LLWLATGKAGAASFPAFSFLPSLWLCGRLRTLGVLHQAGTSHPYRSFVDIIVASPAEILRPVPVLVLSFKWDDF